MRGWLLALMLLPVAALADPRWPEYRVIMWADQSATGYETLRGLGVDAGKVMGIRTAPIDPAAVAKATANLRTAGTPYYVENIATDFYAPYHRWTPEHPRNVSWLMDEVRRRMLVDPADPGVYLRQPSLSDEVWIDRIRARLAETVRLHAPNRPLFYNLGDETGIADLTTAWDFDFSPASLAAFRAWLRGEYASLGALNAEWGTSFAAWDAVMPEKTTPAMARTDGNYASWSDFKDFMDWQFAQALRAGTEAVHAADATALAAIEGAQAAGRGGYDYTRLPGAVDVMEMYVAGGNLAIARAVNPAIIPLSTSFGSGAEEISRIWHEALMGVAGSVVWDDPPLLGPDGAPTARGRALAPVFQTLTGGLGAQLLAAQPAYDPVAILYSPASQRVRWLLDRRPGGARWVARTSEVEGGADDALRQALEGARDLMQHIAVQPHMITPRDLAAGALETRGIRLLVLPQALALSDAEVTAIRRFIALGGQVIADAPAGVFDGHGRARRAPVLPNFPGIPGNATLMGSVLARAWVRPVLRVVNPDGTPAEGVRVHLLRNGAVTIAGVQMDYVAGAGPRPVTLMLPAPAAIQNMRGGQPAMADRTALTLDPVVPALLAISAAPLPRPVVAVVTPGRVTRLVMSLSGVSPAAVQVVRLELIRPDGTQGPAYNVPLSGVPATPTVTFDATEPGGQWIVRARDMMGGGQAEARLSLPPP